MTHLSSSAQEIYPAVVELRETVSKIVDIQTLESDERLDWEARKSEMTALLELHRKEMALLDEELSSAGSSAPGHDSSSESLKYEIEDLKNSRRIALEAVARNVPRALKLSTALPTPLLAQMESELAALRAWSPSTEPREALRSMLSMLGKAQQFNHRFNRSTQVIGNREADVLYLGLGCAFYTDLKGNAGIGRPAGNSWEWVERPELYAQIRTAFETLDKKIPPTMVELPLRIR